MTRPTRVALFCSTTIMGGTERMSLEFLSRCDRSRFEPHLFVLLADGLDVPRRAAEMGIPCEHLRWRGAIDFGALRRFRRKLREWNIDLIHNFGLRAELVSRLNAKRCGVRWMVAGIRDIGVWRKRHHILLNRSTMGAVDLFIANSREAARRWIERENIPRDKTIVIHNGLEPPSRFPERATAQGRFGVDPARGPVIAHLANLTPGVKGHDVLFDAAIRLREEFPGLLVVCVGRDKSNGAIPALAREKGLADVVTFTGFCEDVYAALALADVATLPSRYESFPVSLLEAGACGLPVAASDIGGIPEALVAGETGLLSPPADAAALAENLATLLRDPERRRAMGQAARERVRDVFSMETMMERWQTAYDDLIVGRVASQPDLMA